MGAGRNRNRPCWCNSGIKYKNCHLGREREMPIGKQVLHASIKTEYWRKECFHPQADGTCREKAIKAHAIQRNGIGLAKIAVDGKVYAIRPSISDIFDEANSFDSLCEPRLIPIGEASTFHGFCGKHDTEFFAPLENGPFTGMLEQCFLLNYRALCLGLYRKKAQLGVYRTARNIDKGRSLFEQIKLQKEINGYETFINASISDTLKVKAELDAMWLAHDFSRFRYCIIKFTGEVNLLSSSMFLPTEDFQGQEIQVVNDPNELAHHGTVSVLWTATGSVVVFSWLEGNHPTERLVRSLLTLPHHEIPDAILRLLLSHAENTFYAPAWWDTLPIATKKAIAARFKQSAFPDTPKRRGYLVKMDSDRRTLEWHFISQENNFDTSQAACT